MSAGLDIITVNQRTIILEMRLKIMGSAINIVATGYIMKAVTMAI